MKFPTVWEIESQMAISYYQMNFPVLWSQLHLTELLTKGVYENPQKNSDC